MFNKKNFFITGATGSFGKSFVTYLLNNFNVNKIILFSRDELKQYELQQNPLFKKNLKKLRFFIGDIRDFERLNFAVSNNEIDYMIHAAALKQVPTAEYNPFEVIKTNVIGSQNIIQSCIKNKVKKIIALSTDKAAAPVNLYGATKLTSDKLFISANNYKKFDIKFSVVRYGNVMGSRGSVIPNFIQQSNDKKNFFTITDKSMTRFNITLDESIKFVLNCFKLMWGGELFVPKIPSYKILDVAKAINSKMKIQYIGIRPGEKLHEEMITETDSLNTAEFDKYFVIMPNSIYYTFNKEKFLLKSNPESRGKIRNKTYSYNSRDNDEFLSIKEIKNLIKNNKIS